MGKPTGFLELDRADRTYKPVDERVKHWKEFVVPLTEKRRQDTGRAAAWIAAFPTATTAAR